MIPPLHILTYASNERGADAATLIFRTLRTGFPAANVCVWGNALPHGVERKVREACAATNCSFNPIASTSHDAWLEGLILSAIGPIWVADTDVIFWDKVEDWFQPGDGVRFAGRYEPEFHEPWSRCNRPPRIHPCLLYCAGPELREAIRQWMCKIPMPLRYAINFPLIRQTILPTLNGGTMFYDTLAGLHAAIGGTVFTAQQDSAFEHLNCGTYVDLITPHLGVDLAARHREIYKDITLARGIKAEQDAYLESRKAKLT